MTGNVTCLLKKIAKFIIAANAEFFDELEIDEIIVSNFVNVSTILKSEFSWKTCHFLGDSNYSIFVLPIVGVKIIVILKQKTPFLNVFMSDIFYVINSFLTLFEEITI